MQPQIDSNSVQYLSLLLNDVEQTKNFLGAYNNLDLQMKQAYNLDGATHKEADAKLREMSQADKQQLAQTVAFFRSYSTRAYINFKSISKKFVGNDKKELIARIDSSFKIIQTTTFPPMDVAFDFVQSINDLFVEEINVQALINTKQKLDSLASVGTNPEI